MESKTSEAGWSEVWHEIHVRKCGLFSYEAFVIIRQRIPALIPWFEPAFAEARRCCEARPDPAHDIFHISRVATWCIRLWLQEIEDSADLEVILAAALFHDAIVRRKDDPAGKMDTKESAAHARSVLPGLGFPEAKLDQVCAIVERCSFSNPTKPQSIEEEIVRDADMLEALGASGVTRFFMGAGMMNRAVMDLGSDECSDPRKFSITTLSSRGLAVMDRFYTSSAKRLAIHLGLDEFMRDFIARLHSESRFAKAFYEPPKEG